MKTLSPFEEHLQDVPPVQRARILTMLDDLWQTNNFSCGEEPLSAVRWNVLEPRTYEDFRSRFGMKRKEVNQLVNDMVDLGLMSILDGRHLELTSLGTQFGEEYFHQRYGSPNRKAGSDN